MRGVIDDVFEQERSEEEAGTGRTTTRALATAIALLIVSVLVVTRSRAAFDPPDTDADVAFAAASVELTDDDQGSSLFRVPELAPDDPVTDCIEVTYRGGVLPVAVTLAAEARGALADHLQTRVEVGSGGGFGECRGFESDGTVYDGTLAGLAEAEYETFVAQESPARRVFRFTFTLVDPPETGHPTATADFLWRADHAGRD